MIPLPIPPDLRTAKVLFYVGAGDSSQGSQPFDEEFNNWLMEGDIPEGHPLLDDTEME